MYTTINENGVLNNYATEPKVYYAEYPSSVTFRNKQVVQELNYPEA
jgi:hypothetical protein